MTTPAQTHGSPNRDTAGPWTTRELLRWTGGHFEKLGLDAPRLTAEILLAHVLDVPRLRLYMDIDRPSTAEERQRLRELVQRAARHEPVDYLVGHAEFFAMRFAVDPRVLIPRPCTELIVEHVLQRQRARRRAERGEVSGEASGDEHGNDTDAHAHANAQSEAQGHTPPQPRSSSPAQTDSALRILDLGTGSGCIAIALAAHLPGATIVATDLSDDALQVAADNARTHGVQGRVDLRRGDFFEPIQEPIHTPADGVGVETDWFDYIVSNPPYIPDHEWPDVAPNVREHEPEAALRGGADGLSHVRPIVEHAMRYLRPGGQLLVEIAASTADAVARLAHAAGWSDVRVLSDHEALPRVLVVTAPPRD